MSHYKPDPNKNVNLFIDGRPVTVPEGTRILEAARKADVFIPTLCEHPNLCKRAVCRICVVECDGRGKLMAACANDVSEGVHIVTHNARLDSIRKTIIELILQNHPQECLTCIRNNTCELQKLAADYGIRESAFRHGTERQKPAVTESNTLVRDMGKCVKCGRCVETCQNVQSVGAINSSRRGVHYEISAPYGESPADGLCVYCGQCAQVCPVGAICEHDQSAEAWTLLQGAEPPAVQVDPSLAAAFDDTLGLPARTVSAGKLVTAIKRLGFSAVFDSRFSARAAATEVSGELLRRIRQGGKLPLVAGCSQGWVRFAENFYPDMMDHIYRYDAQSRKATVSIEPCLAKKYKTQQPNVTLTVQELTRMFRLIGVDFTDLPESPFDVAEGDALNPADFRADEAEVMLKGARAKILRVHGLGNARATMESIRRGECDATVVEIMCCPGNRAGCGSVGPYMADALRKLDG